MNTKVCLGYNSKCEDNKHILLLDYDVPKYKLKDIENNLYAIQQKFNIPTFYIIDSTNGYNAISLGKLSLSDNLKVRSKCKYADALHTKIGYKRKGWVLRTGKDKKTISIISNISSTIEKSNAHRILMLSCYDTSIPYDKTFDNYYTVLFEKYVQKRSDSNEKRLQKPIAPQTQI